jgi:3-oxoacyl-[acyl-carrier protein] reductase
MQRTTRELEGKVALVTGGGTGIGRGIALALAAEGVRVAVMGRRQQPLKETVAAMAPGGAGLVVPGDVAVEADVTRTVAAVREKWGPVQILINNAGIGGSGPIHAHDVATWDRVLAVNLRGPFLLMRAVLPEMRGQREGHIINISSESGLEHYTGDGAYGVAKHALNALGEYVQRENQAHNIRVDTVCPGMVVTEMTQDSAGLDQSKCLYPADIADLVLWLLQRRSNTKIGRPVLIQTMLNPWE